MRIALGVEYDGSAFSGWQYQDHSPSVQEAVEKALSAVADVPVRVICAGRTDTGVHAGEQVIHFDTDVERSMRSWVFGANANLPKEVVILWAAPVSDEFHARFSAQRRRYRYVIFNRDVRPTFLARRTAWDYRPLDEQRMAEAARSLLGEHDFSSYRAVACQAKSPVKTVYSLEVKRSHELIFIDIEANAFLHHMVRNITGVLMAIGAGEQPVSWTRDVLEQRDRTLGGVTAPPGGLYLTRVTYPEVFNLPQIPLGSSIW
jgi:tRNA pseudouridine38-40 synthase